MINGPRTSAAGSTVSRRAVLTAATSGLVVAGLGAAGAPGAAQSGTPQAADPGPAFSTEVQLALHEIVERRLGETQTPGILAGIWYPGRGTWLHGGGIGDLATAAPVRLDDHVRIASITKTFVATVVLQLVDDGLVGLDDPIEDYVPGVPNGTEITVRQVLGMDSGIADFVAVPELAKEYAVNPLAAIGPDQLLQVIRESTPDFAPGAELRYSNSNYIVLGFLIEAVTGQSPAAAIEQRIIEPLDLTGTSFPLTPVMPEPYMHGYFAPELGDPLIDVTRSNPQFPWTAGAIISTLADMKTWGEALATGSLLSPETQAARLETRGVSSAPGSFQYGLGLLTVNGLIGHNGGIPGYNSWLLHDPESGFTIALVVNRAAETGGTADLFLRDMLALLLPGRFPPAAATPTP